MRLLGCRVGMGRLLGALGRERCRGRWFVGWSRGGSKPALLSTFLPNQLSKARLQSLSLSSIYSTPFRSISLAATSTPDTLSRQLPTCHFSACNFCPQPLQVPHNRILYHPLDASFAPSNRWTFLCHRPPSRLPGAAHHVLFQGSGSMRWPGGVEWSGGTLVILWCCSWFLGRWGGLGGGRDGWWWRIYLGRNNPPIWLCFCDWDVVGYGLVLSNTLWFPLYFWTLSR